MKIKNTTGLALHFFPMLLNDKKDRTKVNIAINSSYSGNKIAFFIGDMPAADVLYQKTSYADILTTYNANLAFKIDDMELTYTYDKDKKERIVQKTPVDAVEYNSLKTGTLGWCAIQLVPQTPNINGDYIIYSNNLGTWSSNNIIAMFEKLECEVNKPILFKDLTISIKDVIDIDLV